MAELRDSRGLTESEAIARYRSRSYPKPAMTADIVVFHRYGGLKVLLVKRGGHPYLGRMALPGGFANENEPIEDTAARELQEESGVSGLDMRLVGVFSRPGRDPRGWVVSVAYAAVTDRLPPVQAGDDASEAGWYSLEARKDGLYLRGNGECFPASQLAFDHGEILRAAMETLKLG